MTSTSANSTPSSSSFTQTVEGDVAISDSTPSQSSEPVSSPITVSSSNVSIASTPVTSSQSAPLPSSSKERKHSGLSDGKVRNQRENEVMAILPTFINHDGLAINCCCLDPTGVRLATGGADSTIRIWAVAPILSAEVEGNKTQPKLLATLPNHLQAVNAVQFNHDGSILASCSDGTDPYVILWHLRSTSSSNSSFGNLSSTGPSVEDWTIRANLRGHKADIQDLCFSPCHSYLASASVDNTVIIWSLSTNAAIHVLKGHKGWVKGVSWDPLGRYLASVGEDGAMIVWDTADSFRERTRITECFIAPQADGEYGESENGNDGEVAAAAVGRRGINQLLKQITFIRISWSADGLYLAASKAVSQKKVPVVAVYKRGSWNREVVFVGHKFPTTVAKFNPNIFTSLPPQQESNTYSILSPASPSTSSSAIPNLIVSSDNTFSLCAVGSLDNSVSVWSTSSATPIVHINEFFKEAVEDISWSADGLTLVACSHDGNVALLRFGKDSMGKSNKGRLLTEREKASYLRQLYGEEGGRSQPKELPESELALELEEEVKELEKMEKEEIEKEKEKEKKSTLPDPTSTIRTSPADLLKSQTISRRADGRRIVKPLNVDDLNRSAAMATVGGSSQTSTLPPAFENQDSSSSTANGASSLAFSSSTPTESQKRKRDIDMASAAAANALNQKKKKLQPASLSAAASNGSQSFSTTNIHSSNSSASSVTAKLSTGNNNAQAKTNSAPPPNRAKVISIEPLPSIDQLILALPLPPQLKTANSPLTSFFSSSAPFSSIQSNVEVHVNSLPLNQIPPNTPRTWSTLHCIKAGMEQWQTLLPTRVLSLVASNDSIICACRDSEESGSLYVLSKTGARLLPPIHLPALPAHLSLSNRPSTSSNASPSALRYLLLITSDATLTLFSLMPLKRVLTSNVASLLISARFSAARVTADGEVFILLSNNHCYLYNCNLALWMEISSHQYWASEFQSSLSYDIANSANTNADSRNKVTVSSLQIPSRFSTGLASILMLTDRMTITMHTIQQAESQLAAALMINSATEYKILLQRYVQKLVSFVDSPHDSPLDLSAPASSDSFSPSSFSLSPLASLAVSRLHELSDSLLGPILSPPFESSTSSTSNSSSWSPFICTTLEKRKLLRSLLPIMARSKQLQRMTTTLAEQLQIAQQNTFTNPNSTKGKDGIEEEKKEPNANNYSNSSAHSDSNLLAKTPANSFSHSNGFSSTLSNHTNGSEIIENHYFSAASSINSAFVNNGAESLMAKRMRRDEREIGKSNGDVHLSPATDTNIGVEGTEGTEGPSAPS